MGELTSLDTMVTKLAYILCRNIYKWEEPEGPQLEYQTTHDENHNFVFSNLGNRIESPA